jgi:hypothetical protein
VLVDVTLGHNNTSLLLFAIFVDFSNVVREHDSLILCCDFSIISNRHFALIVLRTIDLEDLLHSLDVIFQVRVRFSFQVIAFETTTQAENKRRLVVTQVAFKCECNNILPRLLALEDIVSQDFLSHQGLLFFFQRQDKLFSLNDS